VAGASAIRGGRARRGGSGGSRWLLAGRGWQLRILETAKGPPKHRGRSDGSLLGSAPQGRAHTTLSSDCAAHAAIAARRALHGWLFIAHHGSCGGGGGGSSSAGGTAQEGE
jgi:hypothetical protein